jgi:cell division protein FtsZ
VARIARQLGALTIGVVTRPFTFEGRRRATQADSGITSLREEVDTLITIPNDRLLSISDRHVSVLDAFRSADQVLLSGVQGITDLITTPGLINLDFADVKSVMQGAGSALMGIGSARGEDRAIQAAETAISSPLLEASVDGAHGVLLSIQGGSDLGLFEINEAARLVQEAAHPEANIIFGAVIDDALGDEVRVTVIAAGFDGGAPTRRRDDRALGQISGRSSSPAPAASGGAPLGPGVGNGGGYGSSASQPVATPAPTPVHHTPVPVASAGRPQPLDAEPLDERPLGTLAGAGAGLGGSYGASSYGSNGNGSNGSGSNGSGSNGSGSSSHGSGTIGSAAVGDLSYTRSDPPGSSAERSVETPAHGVGVSSSSYDGGSGSSVPRYVELPPERASRPAPRALPIEDDLDVPDFLK